VGTRDFFDIRGSWDTFREVKLIYGRMGFGERVDLFESDEEHGFTKPRRVSVARWMKRWLLRQDEAIDEPDLPIATDAELQCTRTGQVLTDFKGRSVFDLNRERERELRKNREEAHASLSAPAFRTAVRKQIGLANWRAVRVPLAAERTSNATSLRFQVDRGVTISGVEVQGGQDDHALTLVIVGADRKEELAKGAIAKEVGGTHRGVVLLDLRGLDSTTSRPAQQGRESPFGPDWREAFLSLSIDRPLLGQRTSELLDMLETLNDEPSNKHSSGFHVVGVGTAGLAVLHAALLDERGRIKKVTIENSLVSWSNIIEKGLSRDQLANVLVGVLKLYDLPDLAARLAPMPLSIVNAEDALGKAIPVSQVRETYAGCIRNYGGSGRLEIR
jgi:hypothetical protein